MNKLLLDEQPLFILPSLAVKLGLAEAIIIQQLHYWLQKSDRIIEGERWIYKAIEEWKSEFPFWCAKTIQRTLTNLKDDGLIKTGNFNSKKYDKTVWYTIDYDKINNLENVGVQSIGTKCPKDEDKMSLSRLGQNVHTNTREDINNTDIKPLPPSGHQDQKAEEEVPYEKIGKSFNSICADLPNTLKITATRKKHIAARWKEHGGGMVFWEDYFLRIHRSDFLNNRDGNNKNKWRADFDWVINENNMAKILEGKYDNKIFTEKPTKEQIQLDNLYEQGRTFK